MRIAFIYDPIAFGAHRPPIDVRAHESRSMTGTDLCAVRRPLEMARRGHDVTLYMDRAEPHEHDGLKVDPFSKWEAVAANYDVVIAISNPNALKHARAGAVRITDRQVARFGIDCADGWQKYVDLVVCPSKWARDLVRAPLGDDAPRFDVLPSGCAPQPTREKIPGRCVYISSPDRGLHWVLQAWPHIRRRVPHATLRIAYESIGSWTKHHTRPHAVPVDTLDEEQIRRAHYIAHGLERLKAHGVECVPGGLTHGALQDVLAEAECLLYPLDPLAPTETFGIAVLEAQSHGVVPVLSDADAFGELWGESSVCVKAPISENIGIWTANAVSVLTDATYRAERSASARANAAKYSWGAAAEKLEALIFETEARKHAPRVSLIRPEGLTIHGILSPYASGDVPIDPERPYDANTGGGCRTGFSQLMRGLAAMGHRVRAFSTWSKRATVEGVEHLPFSEAESFVANRPDVSVSYYDTSPVRFPARFTVASHHTYAVPFPASIPLADLNTAPSEHAVNAVRGCYGGRRWLQLPNIVPPGLPRWTPTPGRVLYHTSADRGLHRLVEVWPEIRRRVPHATLHVVGPVEEWTARMRTERCAQGDRARALLEALPAACDAGGVELLGRLSRADVMRELSESSCFAFPADPAGPCEVWSTSIAECMAVGVPVVLAPCDSLAELWEHAVAMTTLKHFASDVETLLTEDRLATHVSERQRAAVAQFTAENAARILDASVRGMLGERRVAA